jgi:predicted lysophospholipase L1 biosynthesis ABC-type transport system permease subunit
MFNKVSYRRGVIEGLILYTLGRLGALVTPAFFPGWLLVAAPLLFLLLQFLLPPLWATRRIQSTRRERLSKRFLLLGPLLAALCIAIDLVISLAIGLAIFTFTDTQRGPALWRFFVGGANHLSLLDFGIYEARSVVLLLAFFTLTVVCTRLAQGGFLRFTMPSGGNRVTL